MSTPVRTRLIAAGVALVAVAGLAVGLTARTSPDEVAITTTGAGAPAVSTELELEPTTTTTVLELADDVAPAPSSTVAPFPAPTSAPAPAPAAAPSTTAPPVAAQSIEAPVTAPEVEAPAPPPAPAALGQPCTNAGATEPAPGTSYGRLQCATSPAGELAWWASYAGTVYWRGAACSGDAMPIGADGGYLRCAGGTWVSA